MFGAAGPHNGPRIFPSQKIQSDPLPLQEFIQVFDKLWADQLHVLADRIRDMSERGWEKVMNHMVWNPIEQGDNVLLRDPNPRKSRPPFTSIFKVIAARKNIVEI